MSTNAFLMHFKTQNNTKTDGILNSIFWICKIQKTKRLTSILIQYKNKQQSYTLLYFMKQLAASQPLVYRLPNAEINTALPYIDEELPQFKTKVQYLIKAQENALQFNPEKYLRDLPVPETPFTDSDLFKKQVERIMEKMGTKGEKKKEEKDKVFDIPVVRNPTATPMMSQSVRNIILRHESNLLREVNLELSHKFGPVLMKEEIAALDNRKQVILEKIKAEREKIDEINKKRRYNHLQSQQREETVSSRTQVMIHKQKRVQ